MRKTTTNKFYKIPTSSATALMSALFLFVSFTSFAQLKVNPNTTFTVKNVVSSKEEANIFDSSILGEDQLVLNGQNQFLETSENTSIPTLRVTNADELQIQTSIHLRGDLVVESGILMLDQPLHITGDLILLNDAKVHNDYLIIYENRFVFEKDFTGTSVLKLMQSTPLFLQVDRISVNTFIMQWEKPTFGLHPNLVYQFKGMPFSPPPEATPLT